MIREVDDYFLQQPEPIKSCLLSLRHTILSSDSRLSETWKYRMPFYCYNGKMCCYLWVDKKLKQPYLGIVEGHLMIDEKDLVQGNRARMKIMMFDPDKDLPIRKVNLLLKKVLAIYRK